MNKFEKLKRYYENGLWDIKRLKNAVSKGWITQKEFEEIIACDKNGDYTKEV